MNMVNEKKPKFTQLSEPETWESGEKASIAAVLERDDGTKGISIKMGKKVPYMPRPRYSKTIWIDEELDLPSWLGWFIKTIKKQYFNLFGKKLASVDEEIERYKAQTELLTMRLAEAQTKLETAENKASENKLLLNYASKVKDKLASFKTCLHEFKQLVDESIKTNVGTEEAIKNKIKENQWLLGLECAVEAKNQNIDTQTQIDLHIKTKYNQDRIFELKSPNLKPFKRKADDERKRLALSQELSEGLSELVIYLERTNLYSNQKSEGTYGITKPSGYVIIGYELDEEESRFLKYLNFHLYPHIQISAYKDLLANAERELRVIEINMFEGGADNVTTNEV